MAEPDGNPSIGARMVRVRSESASGMAGRLQRALLRGQLLDEPPPMVGRYQVRRRLGGGGMGMVFEGWDPRLARAIAIKVLHAETSASPVDLEHEARLLARLSDPAVVTVYDVGVEEGQVYLCMALVDGGDAAAWLAAHGPVGWATILEWFADAARGLHAAHQADIVHCDFKLENLLIGSDRRARVTDFGLARLRLSAVEVGDDEGAAAPAGDDQPASARTWSGIAGTPGYIAPEVRAGATPDARADQWALFVALERALAHAEGAPPAELTAMIERGTAAEPELRYPNLATVEHELRALLRRATAPVDASLSVVRPASGPGPTALALGRLTEIATQTRSRAEFRREALAWIDRHVGFDTALFGRPEAVGAEAPTVLNFDPAFVAQFAAQPERYAPTLAKIIVAAATRAAPLRDVDVYGLGERSKTPFYTELIGRKGSKVMTIGALTLGGALRGTVQISRAARGAVFRDLELELLRQALPILALGEGVHPVLVEPAPSLASASAEPGRVPNANLTKREREVLDYVALGLTNAEIALACGTSINTVRSQVASLLRKVGAASRTELVALALREGISTGKS